MTGCTCGHSAVAHRRYRECEIPGCVCWKYRRRKVEVVNATCLFWNCTKPQHARGICSMHWTRIRTHGTPHAATLMERVWSMFDRSPSGCWEWKRLNPQTGYGASFRSWSSAHRAVYELLVEPIPVGLTIDHLCRNQACVNPAHLEPVTNAENTRRATSVIHTNGICSAGHHMDEANTYVVPSTGQRRCRECYRQRARVSDARRRGRSEPYPARVTTGQPTTKTTERNAPAAAGTGSGA